MTTITKKYRRSTITLAMLGLLSAFAAPADSHATPPATDEATPIAAEDDDDCEEPESAISLEIDVATGYVYRTDQTGGPILLTNNDVELRVGDLSEVVIDLTYTSSEWMVDVVPLGGASMTYSTTDGELSIWASTNADEYMLSSTEVTGMSTMVNMTPILPDIVIKLPKICPPTW